MHACTKKNVTTRKTRFKVKHIVNKHVVIYIIYYYINNVRPKYYFLVDFSTCIFSSPIRYSVMCPALYLRQYPVKRNMFHVHFSFHLDLQKPCVSHCSVHTHTRWKGNCTMLHGFSSIQRGFICFTAYTIHIYIGTRVRVCVFIILYCKSNKNHHFFFFYVSR